MIRGGLFVLAVLLPVLAVGQLPAAVTVDRVVAVVNKEIITQSELEELARAGKVLGEPIDRKVLLNRLIEKRLELQWARRKGVRVEEAELRVALEDIKERNNFPTDEAFRRALSEEGVSWEKYLENLREELTLFKLMNRELTSHSVLSEEEIQRHYEEIRGRYVLPPQIRIRQILIALPEGASAERVREAQRRIVEAESLLAQGEPFARVAESFGEGPERRAGGDIGIFRRGELAPGIERVVFELDAGDVSGPVRSPVGFHLFQVEERFPSAPRPLSEVRREVEEALLAQKREVQRHERLSELWGQAYVEVK